MPGLGPYRGDTLSLSSPAAGAGGSVLFRDSGNSKHPSTGQSSSEHSIILEWEGVISKIFLLVCHHYLISSEPFLSVLRTHKGWLMEGLPLKPTPGYFLFIYIECKDGSEHNGAALWKVAIQLFNKAVKELEGQLRVQFRTTGLNGFAIIRSSMAFILSSGQ